jgi:hypothetical protein
VDFIALFQQKFGQICAILAGDTGNKCFFHRFSPVIYLAI